MSCNEELTKKLREYALSKILDGGMDIGASDIMRQYAIYEEYKDKLHHEDDSKNHVGTKGLEEDSGRDRYQNNTEHGEEERRTSHTGLTLWQNP